MIQVPGYLTKENIYHSKKIGVYRAIHEESGMPVVISKIIDATMIRLAVWMSTIDQFSDSESCFATP